MGWVTKLVDEVHSADFRQVGRKYVHVPVTSLAYAKKEALVLLASCKMHKREEGSAMPCIYMLNCSVTF